jgi:chromosomal replication initiation ATPase DnaA
MRQLILDLIPDHPPTLENFAVGGNADALTALAAWLSAENRETCLFLWGESGAGKTHLLRACGAESASTLCGCGNGPGPQHAERRHAPSLPSTTSRR